MDFARLKILVVEDHSAQATALRAMLQAFGIGQIDIAASAETAAQALVATAYDLILCDYNLGTGNGLALVKTVRDDLLPVRRNMPIVMLTGDTRPERNLQARIAGVDSFLSKPVQPDMLLRTIRIALGLAPATATTTGPSP